MPEFKLPPHLLKKRFELVEVLAGCPVGDFLGGALFGSAADRAQFGDFGIARRAFKLGKQLVIVHRFDRRRGDAFRAGKQPLTAQRRGTPQARADDQDARRKAARGCRALRHAAGDRHAARRNAESPRIPRRCASHTGSVLFSGWANSSSSSRSSSRSRSLIAALILELHKCCCALGHPSLPGSS